MSARLASETDFDTTDSKRIHVHDFEVLQDAANEARGLALNAVNACKSGHIGLPLGCAEMGAVLFGCALRYNPDLPKWLNRDRFILSAGHGSMFLYSWLHLSGYKVELDDLKKFRVLGSKTPGHPEFQETPGVEATTGPLGQGIANAVGYAVSQKMAAARWNTETHKIFSNRIFCLCSDGCMQEGVALEAVAFAGHNKLDNLIVIYDSNDVTLDAMACDSQSENVVKRFEAIGWAVQTVDGHNMEAFLAAVQNARNLNGQPHLIVAKTTIAKGVAEVAGTNKGHGESGIAYIDSAIAKLGLPTDKPFYVSDKTRQYFAQHKSNKLLPDFEAWLKIYNEWRISNPKLADDLQVSLEGECPEELLDNIPVFPTDAKIATRKASSEILQKVAEGMPHLISGSADLFSSTLNYINASKVFNENDHNGRNIRFGIREHAMCGIQNGFAYDGFFRPISATFLVFADYCRASIRLACISKLPTLYIFTHDSIGVGEDGPTHQPVETVSSLRIMPNLDVIRPADPEETAGAYVAALSRTDGPTLLALSRQVTRNISEIPVQVRRMGVFCGGYIAKKESSPLKCILLSAGTELDLALRAAQTLGDSVRVVSMPSFFRFDMQSQEYKDDVLPKECTSRIAIEAGISALWWKYVGLEGKVIGVNGFGCSAPANLIYASYGITVEAVVEAAQAFQ